jgi:glycosyltransferase involved in cell wall biosynthesis
MRDPAPTLTVFTPTYQRAATLPRVFESLQRQSCHDFTWLIVDDGSTDATAQLVASWKTTARFPIEYVYQENRGKHNAHNAAVARARTALFLIIDSDDELLPHAVETIQRAWNEMSATEQRTLAGIWTLCCDSHGKLIGGAFPGGTIDASLQELRYRYHDDREMMPTFVTDVLRRHPFPETPPGACAYIPEEYVWGRITRERPIRFLDVPCRIYHRGEGLSVMARDQYRYSASVVYGYLSPLANELEWFWWAPLSFTLSAVQAARYALFSGNFRELAATLPWKARLLLFVAVPAALLLLWRDWMTGRIARQLAAPR